MKRIALALLFALFPAWAHAQVVNWGDYQDSNQTIYLYFSTTGTDGVAETLTSGAVDIYEDGSTTQITTAETLTANFDSVTGFNQLAVNLNDAGFETGKTYTCILTAGTVDSVSVAGKVVGVFSVGRYADVTATGGVVQANVVQFGGTNGTFANGRPQVNASHILGTQVENRIWYVKGTGGSDANTGASRGQAFATMATAMTEAEPGDTIYICTGTVTEQVVVSKAGITIDGDGSAASILTYSSGNTLDIQASGVTVRNIKVIASGTSNSDTAIYCFGYRDPTIDRCHIVGKYDGLTVFQCQNVNVTNCTISGTYDGVNDSGSTGYFGNCTISTDCSWSADVDMRAVFGGGDFINTKQAQTRRMVYDNCGFIATRTGTSAAGKYTAAFAAPGMTEFRGYCTFVATASNASYTGNVYGVIPEGRVSSSFNLPGECRIGGGMVYTSTAGSGTAYDLRASNASAALYVNTMKYDAAKVNGTVIDESLKPLTAGRQLSVESDGDLTRVNTIDTGGINAASFAANAINDAAVASDVTIASVTGAVGSVTGAVGSVTAGVSLANGTITSAKFDGTTAAPLSSTQAAYIDSAISGVGGTEPDDRDLEPVQHVWQLKRSGDGTLRSTNPLYIVTGTAQTIRAGWNCDIASILPPGTVISTEATPGLVTASDDVTITAIGHGEKVAKVQLAIASDAVAGSHWIKTTVTNTNGGGPIAVYGEVVIQAEP